jgi:hypothetical protein
MAVRKGATSRPKDEEKREASPAETLNFKVSAAFKKEFKGYAVSQGMTMLELLREGFELSKQKRATPAHGNKGN